MKKLLVSMMLFLGVVSEELYAARGLLPAGQSQVEGQVNPAVQPPQVAGRAGRRGNRPRGMNRIIRGYCKKGGVCRLRGRRPGAAPAPAAVAPGNARPEGQPALIPGIPVAIATPVPSAVSAGAASAATATQGARGRGRGGMRRGIGRIIRAYCSKNGTCRLGGGPKPQGQPGQPGRWGRGGAQMQPTVNAAAQPGAQQPQPGRWGRGGARQQPTVSAAAQGAATQAQPGAQQPQRQGGRGGRGNAVRGWMKRRQGQGQGKGRRLRGGGGRGRGMSRGNR